jgi:hypothetical protein
MSRVSEAPEGERRAAIREAVARIEQELSVCEANGATDAVRSSWAVLVHLLALGPAPELRECPKCHHIGMRAATLCGYCWTKLSPNIS